MSIFDNHSHLNKFRQANGFIPAQQSSTSAYILECQLRQVLKVEISNKTISRLCKATGFGYWAIMDLKEEKILRLKKAQLLEALHKYDQKGIVACLIYMEQLTA